MPPHRWLTLSLTLLPDSLLSHAERALAVELLTEILVDLGGRGVVEGDHTLTTYLPPPPDLESFLEEARTRMHKVAPPGTELRFAFQPHEHWESLWRRGLGPRQISQRLMVAPTWDVPAVSPDQILILLDPGMAFGTAEHATTRACLRLLEGRVRRGDRIADVGAGSGILSIAAARLGAAEVLALESDPMAAEAASENLVANQVSHRVRILVEEFRGEGPLPGSPLHGIVANIQRSVLLPLLPSFRRSLDPGGWMILSGILDREGKSVLASAQQEGFVLVETDREGEWWTGAFSFERDPGL